MSTCEKSITIPADCIANVFGEFDSHVKRIEKTMKVTMIVREDQLKIIGGESSVHKTIEIINSLIALAKRGNQITEQNVDYAISLTFEEKESAIVEIDKEIICHTINGIRQGYYMPYCKRKTDKSQNPRAKAVSECN